MPVPVESHISGTSPVAFPYAHELSANPDVCVYFRYQGPERKTAANDLPSGPIPPADAGAGRLSAPNATITSPAKTPTRRRCMAADVSSCGAASDGYLMRGSMRLPDAKKRWPSAIES